MADFNHPRVHELGDIRRLHFIFDEPLPPRKIENVPIICASLFPL